MATKLIKVSDIKANPNNPRVIKDDKFDKLVTSIKEFPEMLEARPIVVNPDMVVLGGNMRLKALKAAGVKEAPVYVATWDEIKQKEFIIKDNVGFGEWDWDILANEWDAEELEGWGLDLPGFVVAEELQAEEDNFEMPYEIQTDIVLGDLFEIGEHRLLCGDSTDSDQVAKLMNGEKADMVFTDPPYEVDFEYANTLLYSENAHVFVFNNDRAIVRQLVDSPLKFKSFFVFHHAGTAIPQEGGHEIFLDHVLISHEIHGKPEVRYNKGEGTRTVIKGEYRRSENHKHEKPQSIIEPIIKGYSNSNFLILDFFLGSGSTMVAAHQLNRKCYGMELDPKYCQVIVDRMQKLDPTLEIKINGKPYGQN